MFTGFCPEAIDFLWGIRMNNEKGWFLAHKKEYVDFVYEPMKALGAELFPLFADRPGNELKVSRIYRDARMHHPLPYKESIWLCIRKTEVYWAEAPCLYVEISPEGLSYGFLHWQPRPATMAEFRRRLAANPRPFLEMMEQAEKALGYPLQAQSYKRPAQPVQEALMPYWAFKGGLHWGKEIPPGQEMFSPQLLEDIRHTFEILLPVYDYFNGLS